MAGGGKWSSHSPDVWDLEPDRKGADAEGEQKRICIGSEEGRDTEQIVGERRVRKGIDGNAGSVG